MLNVCHTCGKLTLASFSTSTSHPRPGFNLENWPTSCLQLWKLTFVHIFYGIHFSMLHGFQLDGRREALRDIYADEDELVTFTAMRCVELELRKRNLYKWCRFRFCRRAIDAAGSQTSRVLKKRFATILCSAIQFSFCTDNESSPRFLEVVFQVLLYVTFVTYCNVNTNNKNVKKNIIETCNSACRFHASMLTFYI